MRLITAIIRCLVRQLILLVLLLCCGFALFSCSAAPRFIRTGSGDTVGVLEERIRCSGNSNKVGSEALVQTKGKASFYAAKFQGKKTASGELYDALLFTAAHRTLPFGTSVKVINPHNGKSVIVRINDRGPHKKSRIIDLSYAAANSIGMVQRGIISVEIEIIHE